MNHRITLVLLLAVAVVSALGASIFFQNAVMLIYGARYKVYPHDILPRTAINIFGLDIPLIRLLMLLTSIVMMIGLYLFIQRTKIGTAIRAAAIDQGAAAAVVTRRPDDVDEDEWRWVRPPSPPTHGHAARSG